MRRGTTPLAGNSITAQKCPSVTRNALLCTLLALAVISPVSAAPSPAGPQRFDEVAEECSTTATMAPEHHEIPVAGDWTTPVTLDVAVLLVGVDEETAEPLMELASEPYEPLGITLNWRTERLDVEINPPPDTSPTASVLSSSDANAYIQASKDHFGGVRPGWADVVYTMVGSELASSVAGKADCVGGIEYPDAAFAVGEVNVATPYDVRVSAKIAAHEIAHLLAAHHHYANCAQGERGGDDRVYNACTVLFNDVSLVTLKFSTLEGAVIRRWALDYAVGSPTETPGQPEPSPDPEPTSVPDPGEEHDHAVVERSVTLRVEGAFARGRVKSASETNGSCVSDVPLALQKKRNGTWSFTAAVFSEGDGSYEASLSGSGRYRMIAPRIERNDHICGRAISPKRRAYV